jgi:uncharacterized membrane protein YsdA (DUF1294 family)
MKISCKISAAILLNIIICLVAALAGHKKHDAYHYFQERMAMTFISALLLGLTSLCAFTLSYVRKQAALAKSRLDFWLISSVGFFYLMIDEYFMLHEGMDTPLLKLFGENSQVVNLEGLIFAVMAIFGITIAVKCRREITERKDFVVFCVLATVCLAGMILFDLLNQDNPVIKVIEETFKLTGVTFFFTAYFSAMLSQIKQVVKPNAL